MGIEHKSSCVPRKGKHDFQECLASLYLKHLFGYNEELRILKYDYSEWQSDLSLIKTMSKCDWCNGKIYETFDCITEEILWSYSVELKRNGRE